MTIITVKLVIMINSNSSKYMTIKIEGGNIRLETTLWV